MEQTLKIMFYQILSWSPRLLIGLLVFLLFWFLAGIAKKIINRIGGKVNHQRQAVFQLFAKISQISLLLVGAMTALGTMGINVSALVTGLGLTGFAIGFALKDSLSNVLAGILMFLYQPFRKGDYISVSNHEGEVKSIDLRYTTLNGSDKKILIPNSTMLTNVVTVLNTSKS